MSYRPGCECGSPPNDCSCSLLLRASNLAKKLGRSLPAREETFGFELLEDLFPEAYEKVPESYKADSITSFFIDKNGHLCAEVAWGDEYLYDSDGKWVRGK